MRVPVLVRELRDTNQFPPNNLVLGDSDRSRVLGGDYPVGPLERNPDGLANCGRDREDFDSLGDWDKLGECCEGISGSPSLVGKEDAVHQLPGPGVLYLRRLLIFEGIRGKATDDRDWQEGVKVVN